jgi:hypothetical protein
MSSLVPAALAVLVMLPRLCSPEFGLLDDGLTLRTGHEVVGRWWSVVHLIPETGRFFPAYWMAYAAIVGVVGARPRAFFAVNVLLLATLLALLGRLVRWGGGTQRQAWLAAAFLAACGPAIETFYTLSKAEPLQMIWIGVSLLATSASASQESWPRRAALILLAATALLLAYATKETTLVLIPVSVGWLVLERWSGEHAATSGRFAKAFVAINLVAAAAFAGLRWCYAPLGLTEGTYTRAYSLDPATVGGALFHIGAWLVRDFAFLAPVLAVAVLVLVGIGVAENIDASRRLVGYACLWMVGWLAVYVPWPVTFQYYLLPFALGAAVVSGVIIGDVASGRRSGRWRLATAAAWLLVTTGFLWSLSIVNAVADARVQLVVDRVNADLVRFLAGAPRGSHVFVNTAYVNEHVFELPLHLSELNGRPDIIVEHVSRFAQESPSSAPVFVVTPETVNQPAPTVRIGVDESGAAQAGSVLTPLLNGRGERVYRAAERTPVLELATHRLLCRLWIAPPRDATYCPADRGVISWRTFVYGWQVHRVRPVTDPAGAETR